MGEIGSMGSYNYDYLIGNKIISRKTAGELMAINGRLDWASTHDHVTSPTVTYSSRGQIQQSEPLSIQEKLEIMSRMTKAWIQIPATYTLNNIIQSMSNNLFGHLPNSDKEFIRAFEEQVEGLRVTEIYEKIKSIYEKLPEVAQSIPRDQLEFFLQEYERLVNRLVPNPNP